MAINGRRHIASGSLAIKPCGEQGRSYGGSDQQQD
jgi:hypothetical protein